MTTGKSARRCLSLLFLAALCAVPLAESIIYDVKQVPIERLARNLEALVANNPKDIQLRVNLARAHAMAYALKKSALPVATGIENQGRYFGWGNNDAVPFKNTPDAPPADIKAAQAQLNLAIARYREALAVGPDDLVANLGYAWCLAQSGDRSAAIAAYRKTIDLAWQAEQKPRRAMSGDQSIMEEAATYLIPLLDRDRDAAEIALLRDRIRTIDKLTTRFITPIAVPLEPGLTTGDLRNDRAAVLFDADGSGVAKRWTWITPKAGFIAGKSSRGLKPAGYFRYRVRTIASSLPDNCCQRLSS